MTTQTSKTEHSSASPKIEQIGGSFYLSYPDDTTEWFRNRAEAECALAFRREGTRATTKTEHQAEYPRIEQSGGLYLPYVKFGAGGPRETIELLGRFRTRAAAERALKRGTSPQRWGWQVGGLV